MEKTKTLWKIVISELQENEMIYILRDSTRKSKEWDGIMSEYTLDQLFNVYSSDEKVKEYWHEDGLCIILK